MKSCRSMETMLKFLTYCVDHILSCENVVFPTSPGTLEAFFLQDDVPREGYLPRLSARPTGFPKWLSWNECVQRLLQLQASLLRSSWVSWEAGRDAATSCPSFGRTWQSWSREGALQVWGFDREAEVFCRHGRGRHHVKGERRRQETSTKLFISWIVSTAQTDNCVFTK